MQYGVSFRDQAALPNHVAWDAWLRPPRREGTTQPNINENSADEDNDELVRRFFLYDNVGALHTVGESPSYIRFAQKITLTVRTQWSRCECSVWSSLS